MIVKRIVTFEGVPEKLQGELVAMLEREIAKFPEKFHMTDAKVSELPAPKKPAPKRTK